MTDTDAAASMLRQIRVTDASGSRLYTRADFPVAFGACLGTDTGGAFLHLVANRVYIDAADQGTRVLINHQPVTGRREIRNGDLLHVEAASFRCERVAEVFSLSQYDDGMSPSVHHRDFAAHGELIEPVAVSAPVAGRQSGKRGARLFAFTGLLLFALLVSGIAYVFTAKTLLIEIHPQPDRVSLSGKIWPLKIRGRYLVQPGEYSLQASKSGYYPLRTDLKVTQRRSQTQSFALQKMPGYISVFSSPTSGARILIDNRQYGITPIEKLELAAGSYALQAHAARYQPYSTQLVIAGQGQHQDLHVELLPGWSEVAIESKPAGAEVWLNGTKQGITPWRAELLAGEYRLELRHQHYLPYTQDFVVIADQPLNLPTVELFASISHLMITSTPPRAVVSVAGIKRGVTPLSVRLEPNIEHQVTLFKPGFSTSRHALVLQPGERRALWSQLEAILGSIIVNVDPHDAQIFVNGKPVGHGTLKLSLPSTRHTLEIKKSGYQTVTKAITPLAAAPQVLDISLRGIASAQRAPHSIRAPQGQELKLIIGGTFSMGAPRRQQGRRSNETLHMVTLRRPFYIGTQEITNAQFAAFKATHRSGTYKGNDLSAPELPVVNVSWEDAARYCNWLSERHGLDQVYRQQGGKITTVRPLPSGYRLPTESEWAWVARARADGTTLRYSWGDSFPPIRVTGNYADQSAVGLLDTTINGYRDGFAVTAPVGSFRANHWGIFNLDGNVAEWCHDYHGIHHSLSEAILIDPLGPEAGDRRVIRGASWMRGDLGSMRLSYRDRDNRRRPDVGFRIAKYID